MRRVLIASAVALAVAVVPAGAQGRAATCAPGSTADACEKATDLFNYMMPQLGTALVGGSHTLGVGSTLGGFPRFALALRGNAVRGDLPDVSDMSVSVVGAAPRDNVATSSQFIGLPGIDFALGIWKGLPVGVSHMGGIDLIGSVTYVPDIENTDGSVSISPTDGSTKIGIGARVGILEQSLVVPGVSFSYLKRDVPTLDVAASATDADFALNDFSVKTTSWRLAAQKNLMLFQLGAGIGQDTYESAADVRVDVMGGAATTTMSQEQSLTRTTYFGSLGFNLFLAKIVAEVGQVSGGEVPMYNTFDEAADKSRLYGSLGIRISF